MSFFAREGSEMSTESAIAVAHRLACRSLGIVSSRDLAASGVSRKQLTTLCANGALVRVLPNTYRVAAVPVSDEQRVRASLAWAGPQSAAWARAAGIAYRLEGVTLGVPAVVVPK